MGFSAVQGGVRYFDHILHCVQARHMQEDRGLAAVVVPNFIEVVFTARYTLPGRRSTHSAADASQPRISVNCH